MPAETDPIVVRIAASMMKFETQIAAITWSAAKSAAQAKSRSPVSARLANAGFAQMGQQASRS